MKKTWNKVRNFGEVRTKNEKTSGRNPNNGRGMEGGEEVLRKNFGSLNKSRKC